MVGIKLCLVRERRFCDSMHSDKPSTVKKAQRRIRQHMREISKVFGAGKSDLNSMCTICQETIDDPMDSDVTICGHVFHRDCSHNYRKHKFEREVKLIKYQLHEWSAPSGLANNAVWPTMRQELVKAMINYETGFSCPNCRFEMPYIHHLLRRTLLKPRVYAFGNTRLSVSASNVLEFFPSTRAIRNFR